MTELFGSDSQRVKLISRLKSISSLATQRRVKVPLIFNIFNKIKILF